MGTSAMSGVMEFPVTTTVGWGMGAGIYDASVADGTGRQPRCCCCCEQHHGREAGVLDAASPAATRFSGPAGSAAVAGRAGPRARPLLVSQLCLLFVLQSSHLYMYRRVEFSDLLVC